MTFRVGMKVVCVDASVDYLGQATNLIEGAVYEVRAKGTHLGEDFIVVAGAPSWHPTKGYRSSRFRPVVERKTDISVFTAMLNPSQVTVDAMNTADFARESAG